MKSLNSLFALFALSSLALAQTPATTGQNQVGPKGPKKQIENKHQVVKPKAGLGARSASTSGGMLFAGVNGSDDCASAPQISGSGQWSVDTTAATTGAEGQASCYAFGTSAVPNDVWYEWTADADGDVVVSTCNLINWDSKIAVYAGAGCPTGGNLVGCNDDASGCSGWSSLTSFSCSNGDVFMIQVGAYGQSSDSGSGLLEVILSPSITNDDCGSATAIAGQGTFSYSNIGATTGAEGQTEGICYQFGSSTVANDVWYEWTPDANGTAVVSMCAGAAHDSKLAAYPGSCATGGALACNDDNCGLASEIQFAVTAGVPVTLQLGSYPSSSPSSGAGSFDISILSGPPANDECSAAVAIAGQGNFAFDNQLATIGAEGQNEGHCNTHNDYGTGVAHDVWYTWTADSDGYATVSTVGLTTNDSKIAAYAGAGCPSDGSAIICNDDNNDTFQSMIQFAVVAGNDYTLQIGGWPNNGSGGTGDFNISINTAALAGDNCENPITIAGQGSFIADTNGMTTGGFGQEEDNCDHFGNNEFSDDMWFEWTADVDGDATVTLCNSASGDSKLGAYPGGSCPLPQTSLACMDDSCSFLTEITFPVVGGDSYLLQVGQYYGAGTNAYQMDISIVPSLSPHPYDDCGSAGVLVTGPNAIDTDGSSFGSAAATTGAAGTCFTLHNDAWYSFTASKDGEIAMIFCGEDGANSANFDTKIEVYDGCGGASVACNDDTCDFGSGVRFASTAGQTYYVQIGGWGSGDLGTGLMSVIEMTGTAFCDANGVDATPCPCGNDNGGFLFEAGCANPASQGAILLAEGEPSVSGNDLSLVGVRLVPNLPMLFFQGENQVNGGQGITFGDGLRCVGFNVKRLIILNTDSTGSVNSMNDGGLNVALEGGVVAGDTRHYQAWYRQGSAGGPCGNSHNLSNGLTITWEL
ncbi:MAG: hypothetical protein MK291_02890 [Planctomycetes bacterium]|nr:hypothetical protein [Planctomycetota bacterium]